MENRPETTPVTQALENKNIPFMFFRHPGKVRSLEQAAKERGQTPDQIVRTIMFRVSQGNFIMVLIAGPEQISWKKIRKYLNQSRITMASEQEILEFSRYPLGAVSPLGLPSPVRTLMDKSVLKNEVISIGSGVRNSTVIMKSTDLLKALGEIEIGDYCKCEE